MAKNGFVAEVTLSQCSIYVESRWLVCMLNIVPKVSSLPSLLPINLVKMEDIDFSNRPHVGHLIKESCLGASEPCLVWCWCIFCRLRYVFYVTPQNDSIEMSCIFMGESSLQHVTTLKSLVIIGILRKNAQRKNASSKTWIL